MPSLDLSGWVPGPHSGHESLMTYSLFYLPLPPRTSHYLQLDSVMGPVRSLVVPLPCLLTSGVTYQTRLCTHCQHHGTLHFNYRFQLFKCHPMTFVLRYLLIMFEISLQLPTFFTSAGIFQACHDELLLNGIIS